MIARVLTFTIVTATLQKLRFQQKQIYMSLVPGILLFGHVQIECKLIDFI